MTIARRILVPEGVSRCYHCISRCVRRAFLCDGQAVHRRGWLRDRLLELDRIFAIEVGGYSIMGNHLHLLVRTQPQWAQAWSDVEVARRWLALYPNLATRIGAEIGSDDHEAAIHKLATDRRAIKSCRRRLASLSWFMKCLKEPIARRANREDRVTGHFWEGRFKVQALLDEAAVLACMVYIDLNPIRAEVARTLEQSDYTSVQDRIHVRQRNRKLRGLRDRASTRADVLVTKARRPGRPPAHDEDGIWLIPVQDRSAGRPTQRPGLFDLSLDEYLRLVDTTGRQVRLGKRGAIPAGLLPILSRLDLDADRWLEHMQHGSAAFGTAVGSVANLAAEATRRGARWVVNACRVYSDPIAR